MDLPFAEDMPYWKSGKSQPDTWLDKSEDIIEKLGGDVSMRAKGKDGGRSAYLIDFSFAVDRFRCIWPVLPTKNGDDRAAERQAATMLYHDVKARSLRAKILGPRTAFFEFLMLDNGRTAGMLSNQELLTYTPAALLPPGNQ